MLDHFKDSQARDVKEGNWTMAPVEEKAVPPPGRAREAFIAAMDRWDEAATDVAVAGLARTAGANEIYELFVRYGARDFRDIGHKAIYVANSWRTLQCIGWQHAEPVLRSLAYALLQHGKGNPADQDDPADRPGRQNMARAARIREGWYAGRPDTLASADLLSTLRTGSDADASQQVVEVLNRGVAPQSIWDALFDGAGELLLRQPGIVALHAVTTTNAMHYAYQATGDDLTRRLLMLQNAAFLPMFRGALGGAARRTRRGSIGSSRPRPRRPRTAPRPIEEIFAGRPRQDGRGEPGAGVSPGRARARTPDPRRRRLVFLKGTTPRLQVQLGRAGGLLQCLALVPRALPGRQHAPAARLVGQGQQPGEAHPRGHGVVRAGASTRISHHRGTETTEKNASSIDEEAFVRRDGRDAPPDCPSGPCRSLESLVSSVPLW